MKTPAIVLATQPLGEADLVVVLLTPELGKLRAAARNARKSKRRFAGGLPSGAMGEASLEAPRSVGSLHRIDQFAPVRNMANLGRDLRRFAFVGYMCEVTDALVREPEPEPHRFAALAEAIERTLAGPPDPGVLRRYELRLLSTLGLLPALDLCCVCGAPRELGPAAAFDLPRGGALCDRHAAGALRELSSVLELAERLEDDADPQPALEALRGAPVEIRRRLRDLTRQLVRAHVDRPLRSLEFFAQIEATERG